MLFRFLPPLHWAILCLLKILKAFLVNVLTPYGASKGSGRYRGGSVATVSISLTQTGKDFLTNYVFEGWRIDGNIVSTSPTYSFVVDKPIKLVASWRAETNVVTVGLAAGVPLTIVLLAVLMFRRRRATLPPSPATYDVKIFKNLSICIQTVLKKSFVRGFSPATFFKLFPAEVWA